MTADDTTVSDPEPSPFGVVKLGIGLHVFLLFAAAVIQNAAELNLGSAAVPELGRNYLWVSAATLTLGLGVARALLGRDFDATDDVWWGVFAMFVATLGLLVGLVVVSVEVRPTTRVAVDLIALATGGWIAFGEPIRRYCRGATGEG